MDPSVRNRAGATGPVQGLKLQVASPKASSAVVTEAAAKAALSEFVDKIIQAVSRFPYSARLAKDRSRLLSDGQTIKATFSRAVPLDPKIMEVLRYYNKIAKDFASAMADSDAIGAGANSSEFPAHVFTQIDEDLKLLRARLRPLLKNLNAGARSAQLHAVQAAADGLSASAAARGDGEQSEMARMAIASPSRTLERSKVEFEARRLVAQELIPFLAKVKDEYHLDKSLMRANYLADMKKLTKLSVVLNDSSSSFSTFREALTDAYQILLEEFIEAKLILVENEDTENEMLKPSAACASADFQLILRLGECLDLVNA